MSARSDLGGADCPASLILVEQSGTKHEIPQPSCATGMAGAEQAMRRPGLCLR